MQTHRWRQRARQPWQVKAAGSGTALSWGSCCGLQWGYGWVRARPAAGRERLVDNLAGAALLHAYAVWPHVLSEVKQP